MLTIRSKNSDQEGRPFCRKSGKRLQAGLRPHHSGDGTGITDRKIAVQGDAGETLWPPCAMRRDENTRKFDY